MTDDLDVFEAERAHLFGVAYRMLGSVAEAEDVLQDAFVRWSRRDATPTSARAFLTTTVVRLCLDMKKSARARRESYVGPWLPEPLVASTQELEIEPDAEARVARAESLHMAFLVLLETLTPLERATFLLREVFDQSFEEIAATLGTTEAACRKLFSRARAHVDEGRPRFSASPAKKEALLSAFLAAAGAADTHALEQLLAEDVVLRSDGGGKVHAALKPIFGRDRTARFILGVSKKLGGDGRVELARVNGEPGVLLVDGGGQAIAALVLAVRGESVTEIFLVTNPDKLARVAQRS